jgi:hypothetical protein
MGFVKSSIENSKKEFDSILDAEILFKDLSSSESDRLEALDFILFNSPLYDIFKLLTDVYGDGDNGNEHSIIDHIFTNLDLSDWSSDEYNCILQILDSQNAYLRNKAITFLQDNGKKAKEFIQDLLDSNSSDLRIFAVNILGDVKYEESRELLLDLIEREDNVNVLMTAVDYIGEIGEEDDIEVLRETKDRFNDNPYVNFGIDFAIDRIKA